MLQNQNNNFHPSKSYLRIVGNITKADNTPYADGDEIALVNNAMMFLFDSIPYKLGSQEKTGAPKEWGRGTFIIIIRRTHRRDRVVQ